ncbi:bacteriochlorophyll 4-vinyl reductase [Rhizobium wuzhouense]|uniref:Bacteriochlorophyll 4-vinyl reductase n=1 Tax=Rhizobium wuzhouense TaxID=1986026 RepID=A0ABX5NSQ8_9HYPH|nr:bacteriochlorophyll 4-vinyl reductase [Rhizobium wuzhouense]PYB75023.1 bacteriochlorophyll 4-vinyl reductase [Rhizobium wuzhouense]
MPTSDRGVASLFERAGESDAAEAEGAALARIGPNAVIQTGQALASRYGSGVTRLIYEAAGLARYLGNPPHAMIDEREPKALFTALRQALPAQEADHVLTDAGLRTANYIVENRIPPRARKLLPKLPPALASRLLVSAIARHAWTFAGSGHFEGRVRGWREPVVILSIKANPLATPGCPWHGAVFQGLFATLTATHVAVVHPRCQARGDDCCEWTIKAATGPQPQV